MKRIAKQLLFVGSIIAAGVCLKPSTVWAGCKMNVYVENTGNSKLAVKNRDSGTGAKTQAGTWRALKNGGWMSNEGRFLVHSGQKKGDEYAADFACGKKRRFRINYECVEGSQKGHEFTTYAPGANTWSTTQTVTIKLTQCN